MQILATAASRVQTHENSATFIKFSSPERMSVSRHPGLRNPAGLLGLCSSQAPLKGTKLHLWAQTCSSEEIERKKETLRFKPKQNILGYGSSEAVSVVIVVG